MGQLLRRTDDGTAVRTISDEELAEGLRKGTIKYVGDSDGSCLYMDTTSGTCVVDSRDPGTLGIISIANIRQNNFIKIKHLTLCSTKRFF